MTRVSAGFLSSNFRHAQITLIPYDRGRAMSIVTYSTVKSMICRSDTSSQQKKVFLMVHFKFQTLNH